MTIATTDDVLGFWRTAGEKKWFAKNDAFDAEIQSRFLPTYEAAAKGALSEWEATADGALALIIVLDQFPRNMFRRDARAFAADDAVRAVADRALARGFDQQVPEDMRLFFYLPFEHSESLADQERAVALMGTLDNPDLTRWAELHAEVIRRFGRFPHRNPVLNRNTTKEEKDFLDSGGFSG